MHFRTPSRLTTYIDILDRATTIRHSEDHARGALVSIDLTCPADLFYSRRNLVAKFSLSFTTQIQDGFQKPIAIQDAKVGYFRSDNNIDKLVNDPIVSFPKIAGDFKDGKAEIEMRRPNDVKNNDSSNIRIVVHLDAYPSNMELSASLSTLSTPDGSSRPSRALTSANRPRIASSPNEERLQKLLCWTACFGYDKLFEEYLDQGPSILDMEDVFGMTPFSWAALAGQASVIRQALQQNGCIKARERTTRGPSPLEAAAQGKNSNIFELFLKYLKSIEGFDRENGEIPEDNELPKLGNCDIEKELNIAVCSEQTATIRRLVDMLLARQDAHKKEDWLARQMVQAAKEGALCLVQVLKSFNAEVDAEADADIDRGNEQKTTPLMSAIKNNQIPVAEFLISHGAGNEAALRVAVEMKQHKTIRAMLQAGTPAKGTFKKELRNIATTQKDSTTLMLLKLEKGTGKLATSKNLDSETDKLFEATIFDFFEDEGPAFREVNVDDLMQKPHTFFSVRGKTKFRWFHLPANNMKWAEALMSKIYHEDPSLVYKVLEPKRWVKRQHEGEPLHEGESGSPHARFMMPACHDFSEAFKDKKKVEKEGKDKHMVLFMPYLHWDEEETMKKRSQLIATYPDTAAGETTSASKEERLLTKYLLSGDNGESHSRHVLHIRRTLDQSLYHNLKDTVIRDADQAVHRYQKKLNKKKMNKKKDTKKDNKKEAPLTVIMVDQLWLWILVGSSGKAEAVVTCFPSRDWSDVIRPTENSQPKWILDRRRTTDVLQITKSYIQQRPNAVKTPYDLAGVIASRCSRALLDHSTDMLNFAEVYENSISDIMNEETLLFNRFNSLMQTRTNTMNGFKEISEQEDESKLKEKNKSNDKNKPKSKIKAEEGEKPEDEEKSKEEIKPKELNSYQDLAMKIWEDVQWLRNPDQKSPDSAVKHCQEYRQYTLETEIPSLDEIKRLEAKISEKPDKEYLIKLLEKFGRFYVLDITREITLLSQIKDIQDELEMMEKVFAEQKEVLETMDRIIHIMEKPNSDPDEDMQTGKPDAKSHLRRFYNGRKTKGDYNEELHDDLSIYDDSNSGSVFGDVYPLAPSTEPQKQNASTQSMIWDLGHQKQNLPLRTVRRHSEQIQKMIRRAKNTNDALSSLVELKQKQNNMIDTRTARLQAEQSHSMTLEAEKQSKTLMVFTIVTIVFLPLSFIAAFFAIPTQEFNNNSLTLGFVSKITFPASAAISFLFIAIGFSVSRWQSDEVTDRARVKFNGLRNKFGRGSNQSSDKLAPLHSVTYE